MFMNRNFICVIFLVLMFAGASNVRAAGSGEIRLELADAAAVGMGSAFAGQADRPSAIFYNPAGIVQMGTAMSIGVTALQPQINYRPANGDEVQMRQNIFVFPHIFFTTPIVKDKFYIGLGESSNWGLGTDWAQDSFARYSSYKSSFENKDFMLVAAYKVNDHLSFAIGADNDDSKIDKEKKLFQGPATSNDGNLQVKVKDNAWGFRLASMYKVNEQHQFGLVYSSAIHHKYEGKLYLDNLQAGGSNYLGIFGADSYETRTTTKFTLPQNVTLGYSFKPTSKWTFNADLQWLDWSSVQNQAFNWPDIDVTNAGIVAVLNTGNPQPRDMKSVWSESFGAQYEVNDRLRLRCGYSHHQTPIGQDTIDLSFMDNNSHAFTGGLGFDLTKKLSIDFAYGGVLYDLRKVDNTVDNGFGANLDGNYKEFIHVGVVTLTYKF